MNRYAFINPVAGNKAGLKLKPLIHESIPNVTIYETKSSEHTTRLAYELSGPDTIFYSVGGDGTANDIVNGMLSGVLAPIPTGSGNDILRSITDLTDPETIIRLESENIKNGIDSETIQHMDLGLIRYKDANFGFIKKMNFLNVVSIGDIAATVGKIANERKDKGKGDSSLAYNASVISAALSFKAPQVRISINGQVIDQRITLFSAGIGQFYGNGYNIFPGSSISDGVLKICYADEIFNLRIPFLKRYLKRGEHGNLDFVYFDTAENIRIQSNEVLVGNVDGQVVESKEYELEIISRGLLISTPYPRGKVLYKR